MTTRKLPIERFWDKVIKLGPDDCWEWKKIGKGKRYGQFKVNGRMVSAHRFSWELVNGPIPKGLYACHVCDNTKCVNPKHLFLGTQKQNMEDCVAKGRKGGLFGQDHANTKFTDSDVMAIRALRHWSGFMYKDIAAEYNVCYQTIQHICLGTTWTHLPKLLPLS